MTMPLFNGLDVLARLQALVWRARPSKPASRIEPIQEGVVFSDAQPARLTY